MQRRTQILLTAAIVGSATVAFAVLRSGDDATAKVAGARSDARNAPSTDTTEAASNVVTARLRSATYVEPPTPQTLATWFRELPRAEDLPADVHFSPPGISRAGERFGTIVEAVQANPSYREEAAQFFGRCSEDTTVLDGIRALCLHNWREYRASVEAVEPRVDEHIKRIASFLPKRPQN